MRLKDLKNWYGRRGLRRRAIDHYGDKCFVCERPGPGLHVHHLDVVRTDEETVDDVVVLCPRCHGILGSIPGHHKSPKKNVVFLVYWGLGRQVVEREKDERRDIDRG